MSDRSPQAVADHLWQRVRRLTEQLRQMESVAQEATDLSPDDAHRLDRTRLRLARALERAQLGDQLADRLNSLPTRARRQP